VRPAVSAEKAGLTAVPCRPDVGDQAKSKERSHATGCEYVRCRRLKKVELPPSGSGIGVNRVAVRLAATLVEMVDV
jgi:hypothetical protein